MRTTGRPLKRGFSGGVLPRRVTAASGKGTTLFITGSRPIALLLSGVDGELIDDFEVDCAFYAFHDDGRRRTDNGRGRLVRLFRRPSSVFCRRPNARAGS